MKNALPTAGRRNTSLIFRLTAGFGTLYTQVAGLHRAVPSTALDKVFNCYADIITGYLVLSRYMSKKST